MKPWSRHEPMDADVSGTTQFEGRTAEEAVARARAALGDSSALRCWKTRRGGVGGFFAKEVFVAGLTPPPGSETMRGKASRAKPGPTGGDAAHALAPDAPQQDGVLPASASGPNGQDGQDTPGPDDHLSRLVEATSDQVSLGSLAIPAEAFDAVLAEAQAALTREREGNGIALAGAPANPGPQGVTSGGPGVPEHELEPPDDGQAEGAPKGREKAITSRRPASRAGGERPPSARPAKKATRPKAKAGRTSPVPRSGTAAERGQRGRAARIPDLRPGLRSLGVPDPYVPRGQRPSLDQLASAMGTLPVAPALPTRSGAVVAVMGPDRDLDRTVDLVTAELSLDQRDVLRFAGSPPAEPPSGLRTSRPPRFCVLAVRPPAGARAVARHCWRCRPSRECRSGERCVGSSTRRLPITSWPRLELTASGWMSST